ncbi:hypothetical protein ACIPY2_14320 [Paenarthrobacter sp. NPDC089675]|uniref:hypothetical protein n=1 Tax=Paenarthrobacter sp. NPDC089675 TaxID=3364376 RepID=UPI00380C8769
MIALADGSRALGGVNQQRRLARTTATLGALTLLLLAGSNAAPATADSVVKIDTVGDNPGTIAVNTATDTAYVSTVEGIFSVRGA